MSQLILMELMKNIAKKDCFSEIKIIYTLYLQSLCCVFNLSYGMADFQHD